MNREPTPIHERSRLRRFINRYEVDQATFFAIVSRGWSFLSGPITNLMIAACFTEVLQDYYFAFWFLLGMQTFFELSMDVVIVNVASHEWASLSFGDGGEVVGDETARRRLSSLRQMTRHWYRIASIVFLIVIGAVGVWFLGKRTLPAEDWRAPWLSLTVLASLQLNLLPAIGLLEGCGQLGFINRVRTVQAVIGSLVVWACIASGLGLWAIVGTAAVRLSMDLWLVFHRYHGFFGSLDDREAVGALGWRDEVWPLQWRLGLQSIITYFSLNMFVAVMWYHAEGVPGQMGMTWTILSTVQIASFSWVETRRPMFGGLIAQRKFEQLDQHFFRLTKISMLVLTTVCTVFVVGLFVLRSLDLWLAERLAERLLPPLPTALLALATIILQVARCQNVYVRAHKKDPFLVPALTANLINIALIWYFGKHYGPIGAAGGFLATVTLIIAPWWWRIWFLSREEWHAAD